MDLKIKLIKMRLQHAIHSNPFPQLPSTSRIHRFYKTIEVVEHPKSTQIPKLNPWEQPSLKNVSKAVDVYYGLAFDGKITQTLYKNDLCIPSRRLAESLAEEWLRQPTDEKIDVNSLRLNLMYAKATRTIMDPLIVECL